MQIKGATKKQIKAIRLFSLYLKIEDFFVEIRNTSEGCFCEQTAEKSFIIYLNSPKNITGLAHELVHVKQYLNKELLELPYGAMWHGKVYPLDDIDYLDEPWEVEAFGREVLLMERWKNTRKK